MHKTIFNTIQVYESVFRLNHTNLLGRSQESIPGSVRDDALYLREIQYFAALRSRAS